MPRSPASSRTNNASANNLQPTNQLTTNQPPTPRSFHGIRPSKNKEDKRLRLAREEIARQKNATSEVDRQQELEGLRKVGGGGGLLLCTQGDYCHVAPHLKV